MSKIIHVVQGSTGEYSDRQEWLVRAFTCSSEANAFVLKCEEHGRLLVLAQEAGTVEKWRDIPEEYLKYDPQMQCDYTGVSYYVEEVELEIE